MFITPKGYFDCSDDRSTVRNPIASPQGTSVVLGDGPAAWTWVYLAGIVGLSLRLAVMSSGSSTSRRSGPGPSRLWASWR